MKEVVRERFGGPEVLEVREAAKPKPDAGEVLVRVHAISLNRADWYAVTGTPYAARMQMGLRRPKGEGLPADFAGKIEAVGERVEALHIGDEVFGRAGELAEYVTVEEAVALKPGNFSFEEAATLPVAGLTALQGLRDKGRLQPGQRVLINGASGGVGTVAVQIAKALGGEVTAVCSTRNVEQSRSLGADHVVDYTREDFTRGDRRYDLILDVAGTKSWRACKRVLEPDGTLVLTGGSMNRFLGPLGHLGKTVLAAKRGSRTAAFFIANLNRADLDTLRELAEEGKLRAVVERRYELGEIVDAFRYLGSGHVRGKLVVALS